jgi:apolipoprotein N-acyltransferase
VQIRQPLALRIYIAAFGVFWCGILVTGLIATGAGIAVFAVPMLAFGMTLCFRLFRLGVDADAAGLMVRNNFRTKRFTWDEIEGFRIGSPQMGMPFGKVIHTLLRDGEIFTLDVTMRPWMIPGARHKLDSYLASLRAWVPQT